jgi:hypothetical protein
MPRRASWHRRRRPPGNLKLPVAAVAEPEMPVRTARRSPSRPALAARGGGEHWHGEAGGAASAPARPR